MHWYDRHARDLPWRVAPQDRKRGLAPDPYRVWLSEIMLQQTTVAAVKAYFERFTTLWPTVGDLARAPREAVLAEWAGLGYYARARNLHACAREVVETHDGLFPADEAALLALPGIGPYTAAAVAAIAFDIPAVVVDGNVERVVSRLFAVEEPLPDSKPLLRQYAGKLTPEGRAGDYAQAMMDLGATLCTPTSPACTICPLFDRCAARKAGTAVDLPRKRAKAPKPTRHGIAFVAVRSDGAVLLDRRAETRLLGGMLEVPCSEWHDSPDTRDISDAPLQADWRAVGGVRHTFTHFHLELSVMRADVPKRQRVSRGHWSDPAANPETGLPTVMKKALRLGLSAGSFRKDG